ncbi:MAG: S8 family peptidase [Bacteroidetes bacterium]|nr:S8 family peptidase [Bacteroidota bacterium]
MKSKYLFYIFFFFCIIISTDIHAQNGLLIDNKILPASPSIGRLDAVLDHVVIIRLKPDYASPNLVQSVLTSLGVRILSQFLSPEQSITRQFEKNNPAHPLPPRTTNTDEILRAEEPLLRTYIVVYTRTDSPEQFCFRIQQSCDKIDIAEPYYIPTIAGGTPNDSLLPRQTTLQTMKAIEAWKTYDGDSKIVIAISDAGTMQDHEDIAGSLWINENEIPGNRSDDDGNGYPDDFEGYNFAWADDGTPPGNTYNKIEAHGTYTAGIAGATSNNRIGIAGAGNKCLIFPLKCASIKSAQSILYGYQSIVYAAIMGFSVINCSWASFNYSCINQSVIDYAVSRNLVVVAAAGNHFATTQVFPASYKGVLGVGLSDENDIVYPNSGLGTNAAVMAPGHLTWTTSYSDKEYAQVGYGTSFASPLAAGMMGIVRGKQPSLKPKQAIEFTRLCTDNIEDNNPTYRGKIGGRLNMLKAVTVNPMSLVAIRPEEVSIRSDSGFTRLFGAVGYNSGSVNIRVKNYLGDAKSVSFHVSTIEDSLHLISIIDSNFTSGKLASGAEMLLNAPTGVRISSKPRATLFLLRFDIEAINMTGDTLRDFFLVPITPFAEIYTYHSSQDSIVMSISDDGNLGYADSPRNLKGIGFRYNGQCSYLIEGGIMASDGKSRVVSQVRNASRQRDEHFSPIIQFNSPSSPLLGIMSDTLAPDSTKLGITVRQRLIPNNDASIIQINLKTARLSTNSPLSIAHYFNWDLGGRDAGSSARIFNEAIPDSIKSRGVATLIESAASSNKIGCAVVACNPSYVPICTVFDDSITYNGFTNTEKITVLSGGVRSEPITSGDLGLAIGMRIQLPSPNIEPNDLDDYALFIIAGKTSEEIAQKLKKAIAATCGTLSAEESYSNETSKLKVIPSPAQNEITIIAPSKSGYVDLRLQNILGEDVLPSQQFFNYASVIRQTIDISALSSGTYYIIIRSGNEVRTSKFLKQ